MTEESLAITITQREAMRITSCLLREALMHDELSRKYANQNLHAIAAGEAVEATILMQLREKFRKVVE